jgi:hypothetical protein
MLNLKNMSQNVIEMSTRSFAMNIRVLLIDAKWTRKYDTVLVPGTGNYETPEVDTLSPVSGLRNPLVATHCLSRTSL